MVRGPSATDSHMAVVSDALARAVDYLARTWGHSPKPFEMRVAVAGSDLLLEEGDNGGRQALYNGDACCGQLRGEVGLGTAIDHPWWNDIARGGGQADGSGYAIPVAANRVKITVHEATHHYSESMGCNTRSYNRRPVITPLWMMEGVAELFGLNVAVADGLLSQAVRDRKFATNPFGREALAPRLEDLENQSSFAEHGYHMGATAVEYLFSKTEPRAMVEFCSLIRGGAGLAWQSAFTQAFGMTPATFYADFRDWWVGYNK